VGDGLKKITRRVARFFKRGDPEPPPEKRLSASQIIKPEETVPSRAEMPAPASTRRVARPERGERTEALGSIEITVLQNGVTHVRFHTAPPPSPTPQSSIPVRDPVTRALSRKKLKDGMKRTTRFYNPDGTLAVDQEDDVW